MDFHNAYELIKICKDSKKSIADVMREREAAETETSLDVIESRIKHSLDIMRSSAHKPLENIKKSVGGLIGGEASKLNEHYKSGKSICGNVLTKVLMYSQAVPEVNASMGVIVAAPTAGSSGVVPAILFALEEEFDLDEKALERANIASEELIPWVLNDVNVEGEYVGNTYIVNF